MTADEAVVAVLESLDAAGIDYMTVGSLASNFHGIPRSTRDADFVVALDAGALERLQERLPRDLNLDRQGAFEAVTGTLRYRITLARSPFLCELFLLSDDPHDKERFGRRVRVQFLGRGAYVATAEDTIVTKLRWLRDADRPKDRDDIRNILAVKGNALDWTYLRRWTDAHGTSELIEQIRASIS